MCQGKRCVRRKGRTVAALVHLIHDLVELLLALVFAKVLEQETQLDHLVGEKSGKVSSLGRPEAS